MKFSEVKQYIRSDLFRYKGKTNFLSFLKLYIKSAVFRWQVAFRLCKGKFIVKLLGYLLWTINRTKRNIGIYKSTKIGYGLFIGHNSPIQINPGTIIGNNCNLSQFITIGTNDNTPAIIGDNVYIGPNVCIVEDVNIGNSVTIGAGSVVTKDLPDNCTAAGNYAKVLNYNNPGRYIKNKWEK